MNIEIGRLAPAALHVDCPRCKAKRGRKCQGEALIPGAPELGLIPVRGYHKERGDVIRACTEMLTMITATQ